MRSEVFKFMIAIFVRETWQSKECTNLQKYREMLADIDVETSYWKMSLQVLDPVQEAVPCSTTEKLQTVKRAVNELAGIGSSRRSSSMPNNRKTPDSKTCC